MKDHRLPDCTGRRTQTISTKQRKIPADSPFLSLLSFSSFRRCIPVRLAVRRSAILESASHQESLIHSWGDGARARGKGKAMFRIDAGRTGRYCDGLNRRSFLQIGVAGMGSASLASLLQAKELGANSGRAKRTRQSSYCGWMAGPVISICMT